MPRLPRGAWVCRSRQLVVGSNRNDILARFFKSGQMSIGQVVPTLSPSMDIQVSSNFERYMFDLFGEDARRVAEFMERFRRVGRFEVGETMLANVGAVFDGFRLTDDGTRRVIRQLYEETGELVDPHTAIGVAAGRARRRDPNIPMIALATAHAAKFPAAVEAATGVRPALPPPPGRPVRTTGALRRAAQRSRRGEGLCAARRPGERMSSLDSVRLTHLPNGLTVVTDRMESVETASLGVWVDAGTRHETADINGVSHLLEHMAFKGTKRRTARDIAEEIEAVGGHLNAYTSREHTAYYAKILKEDVGLAIDIIADILQYSTLDADELAREQAVVVQEISQSIDTPDDIIFDHFQATAFPARRSGGQYWAPPIWCAPCRARRWPAISR